jgi:hypothetical protein
VTDEQKDYFLNVLNNHYPEFITEYQTIYKGDKWGQAQGEYYNSINKFIIFRKIVNGIDP